MKKNNYVSTKKMKCIDQRAVEYGIPIELMMENAGKALAIHIKKKFPSLTAKIVCVVGKGNNGGGVISAARHITCLGRKVTLILIYKKLSNPSKFHFSMIRKNHLIKVIYYKKNNQKNIETTIKNADLVLDGIFGTGFSGIIKEPVYSLISMINRSKSWVIANDVPSGIDADTGKIHTIAVNANHVIVLHKPKKWMHSTPKTKFDIVNIGIPPEIDKPFDGPLL